jgi:hypothetical protein
MSVKKDELADTLANFCTSCLPAVMIHIAARLSTLVLEARISTLYTWRIVAPLLLYADEGGRGEHCCNQAGDCSCLPLYFLFQ